MVTPSKVTPPKPDGSAVAAVPQLAVTKQRFFGTHPFFSSISSLARALEKKHLPLLPASEAQVSYMRALASLALVVTSDAKTCASREV